MAPMLFLKHRYSFKVPKVKTWSTLRNYHKQLNLWLFTATITNAQYNYFTPIMITIINSSKQHTTQQLNLHNRRFLSLKVKRQMYTWMRSRKLRQQNLFACFVPFLFSHLHRDTQHKNQYKRTANVVSPKTVGPQYKLYIVADWIQLCAG